MSETITIPDLSCPKLIDLALRDIQTQLTCSLPWLNYAFGKSEKQVNQSGKTYPAIYLGNEEYLNMLPDSSIGNYSFFEFEDGGEIMTGQNFKNNRYEANFGLTFFFDFREVYPGEHDYKTLQNVIHDVLSALNSARLTNTTINVQNIYERAEYIYRGYDHNEINKQFKKRPLGGFKLTGILSYREGC